jgi:hypothetical protein
MDEREDEETSNDQAFIPNNRLIKFFGKKIRSPLPIRRKIYRQLPSGGGGWKGGTEKAGKCYKTGIL